MTAAGVKPVGARHEFDGVVLRPLEASQLPLTLAWRNRDGVRQRFLNDAIITPEAHRTWYDRYLHKADDVVLLAYATGQDQPFGQLAIYDIDFANGQAEVGRFVVAPERAGQGLMRRALAALVDLARGPLNLRTLKLEVRADNERAIRLYEGIGFVRTGGRDGVIEMRLGIA